VEADRGGSVWQRLALAAVRRYALMLGMSWLPFSALRILVLRLCGVRIGDGCYVGFNVLFDTNYPELITIGDHVTISHDVRIYTHTITPANSRLARVYHTTAAVHIGDGAWLAANSLICPGVTVAPDCLIAAGAVVTKSTEPGWLFAGNPARRIKPIAFDESGS
jgi:acetyltransferase-like isoleucine patch superfamily enzyme